MSTDAVTPLRHRMIEDMNARKLSTGTQRGHIALDVSPERLGRAKVWGTVCFVGERNNATIDVSPDMLRKQLTIIGSWTFSWQGQADCARFVVERKVDVERLFTHRWQLDQAEEAYRLFDTQTTGKGVFLI